MTREQANFRRVATLQHTPRIKHIGVLEQQTNPIYYTLLTLLPGADFVSAYPETTVAQQQQAGKEVARFLDSLHAFSDTLYDIGLYVPMLPEFAGTWRSGHQQYWELLQQGTTALQLHPESHRIFKAAFQFLSASTDSLDYQRGPVVLHNDFHPQNFLLHQGSFSGVIDWECSQRGEADFELCHLIHWCIYPPQPDIDFRPFLRALIQAAPKCIQVPELATRLTVYQVEHEIQQMIWHGCTAESIRVPRLLRWLEGAVAELLQEVG